MPRDIIFLLRSVPSQPTIHPNRSSRDEPRVPRREKRNNTRDFIRPSCSLERRCLNHCGLAAQTVADEHRCLYGRPRRALRLRDPVAAKHFWEPQNPIKLKAYPRHREPATSRVVPGPQRSASCAVVGVTLGPTNQATSLHFADCVERSRRACMRSIRQLAKGPPTALRESRLHSLCYCRLRQILSASVVIETPPSQRGIPHLACGRRSNSGTQ